MIVTVDGLVIPEKICGQALADLTDLFTVPDFISC